VTFPINIKLFEKRTGYQVEDRNHNGELDKGDRVWKQTGEKRVRISMPKAIDAFSAAKNIDAALTKLSQTFGEDVSAALDKFLTYTKMTALRAAFEKLAGELKTVNSDLADDVGAYLAAANKKKTWSGEVELLTEGAQEIQARIREMLNIPHK